jgi:membrane protein implicated in regulation of membrane protease activity
MTVIRDRAGAIAAQDAAHLQSESWPFDVHVLVESASSFDALVDDAHAAVTSPSVVVIALDTAHHKVAVRFGTNTGVKQGDFDSVSKAGNAHFHAGEIRDGIDAILLRAQASAQSAVAMSESNAPVVVQEGLSGGAWAGIIILFAIVAGTVVWLWRRSRKDRDSFEKTLNDSRDQVAELRAHNAREADWEDSIQANQKGWTAAKRPAPEPAPVTRRETPPPRYAAPAYGGPPPAPVYINNPPPVIVNQGGSGGSGYVEGMLMGEILSQPREREVIVEREVVVREERDAGGGSSDWGGSKSSYDDPPAPSPDAGGGGSSWDSGGGGGFDSGGGGGGSDGGGGGGDF